jgi:hypothetical protein
MHLTASDTPIDREQMELCREFARMAKVERTFAVVPDPQSSKSSADITYSLTEAFEMIRDQTAASLSVIFDWKCGGKRGSDSVRFFMPHATATERFVEQTIDNMIAQKITSVLFEDYAGEAEYDGPISVVDEVN